MGKSRLVPRSYPALPSALTDACTPLTDADRTQIVAALEQTGWRIRGARHVPRRCSV
jgi:hypothetical protein